MSLRALIRALSSSRTRRLARRALTSRFREALLFACLLLAAASPGWGEPQPALGGRAFALDSSSQAELWLPSSFLKTLGIEATVLAGRPEVMLHTGTRRFSLPLSTLRRRGGELALPLSALEGELGLRTLSVGGRVYLFPQPSRFNSVLKTERGVRFLLSDFSPASLLPVPGGLELTFFNVDAALSSRRWTWTQGPVRSVTLRMDEPYHRAYVTLSIPPPFEYTLARSETPSAFALELDITSTPAPEPRSARLGEGVVYTEARIDVGRGAALTRAVRIENARELYVLDVVLPREGIGHLEPLAQMARREGGLVAINANFFDPASEHPIGLLIRDGRLEADDYAGRGALAVDRAGRIRFARLATAPSVILGATSLQIDAVNRPPKPRELGLITPDYGRSIRLSAPATLVRIRDGVVRAVQRSRLVPAGPADVVLVVPDALLVRTSPLRVGQQAELRTPLDDPTFAPEHAVGAGPLLVRDGRIVLDPAVERFSNSFAAGRAARSAAGLTEDGALILAIVLADGHSAGMTLGELAAWMRSQGAIEALAFDGGGSASLAFRQGDEWRNVGGTRGVAVGLLVRAR